MSDMLGNGWVKKGSVIAFPFLWQQPAKTEEWVYDVLTAHHNESQFVEFICFPWATLIDLIIRKKESEANQLIQVLKNIPLKRALIRATACQHVNIKPVLGLMKDIGVTDIFWSHKTNGLTSERNIRFHLLPLYPVAFFKRNNFKIKEIKDRHYLYSFIGAVGLPSYTSTIRSQILGLRPYKNSLILQRDQWHFEKHVYDFQIDKKSISPLEFEEADEKMNYYASVLEETIYSLCPAGAGPNSIRYWESLAYGSIPVVLSDDFDDYGLIGPAVRVMERDLHQFISDIKENANKIGVFKYSYSHPDQWLEAMVFWLFKDNLKLLKLVKSRN